MEFQSYDRFTTEHKQQVSEKTAKSPKYDNPPLPELRLVLLGRKGTGKSSSGNTILGNACGFENGKPTEECVKRRADIASYCVTVVDTPGWEWYYSGNGTPSWVTRETMRSVAVCSPGPHALLLVIRSSASVTEDYYRQVEEHLEFLGKTAWAHTVLLFTRGDELGSIPIQQRIQNAGKSFQKLFEKCGSRFHVLENKRCDKDGAQVKELIRKIEEMVKERGGKHYECDPLHLGIEVEQKRRAKERRKKQRIMETQAQKGIIKAVLTSDISLLEDRDERDLFPRGSRRLPELRLILFGERETGKSSAGNTILRKPTFFQTGQATEECSRQQAEISGRMLTVVDVPGWEGGPEGITPDRIKREICASVTLCPPGPHALLLTLRVDALVRATAVRKHLELLGEGIWRHTILLFTRGDQLREGVTIEQHIQGGGSDLHWLMDKCGKRCHVISSIVWESDSSKDQVTSLLEKIEKMVSQNRCEAFSPVVQEIQELGKQKNERFNVKLKEVNEKLQRQEQEIKRMREREVKSIRRIFDWRKDKVKTPEKTGRGRDEGVDRTDDDRKSIMSELEERMVWLTEDREKEIQELSLENNRLFAALNQGYKERGEITMKLGEREKESEELKEKVDDLQVNILEFKRASLLKEQERKVKEEQLIKWHEEAENELKWQLDQKRKEVEGLRKTLENMQQTMMELKRKYEEEISSKKQEQERRLAEKTEFEKRLEKEQQEMDILKLKTEETLKEMNEKRETEKIKLSEMIELMTKEMEELQVAYRNQVKASEATRQIHEETVLKYNELIDKLVVKNAEVVEMAKKNENQNKLKEKDTEIRNLDKTLIEKEREIEALKQNISDRHRAMENMKHEGKAKRAEYISRIKDLEEMEEFLKRENVILKEEIEALKTLSEDNARKKEDNTRKILEVKENIINQLREANEESRAQREGLKIQLKEIHIKVENLQNQNAKLIQDLDGVQIKCEDYKRDLQAQIIKNESREKDIKDILNQSEEMGKVKDALNQKNIEKKEHEICLLKQRNHTQQMELGAMGDRLKELEKKTEKYYEKMLSERIAEMDVKDAEREQSLHNRQLELYDREQRLENNMQELEIGKKELKKRDDNINYAEEELRDKKRQLDRREHEIREKENKLQHQREKNQNLQEHLERREQELTERETNLENKQKEQMDLAEKQDCERENIKKQLAEKTLLLRKTEEELVAKQSDLQDKLKELECHRENLDIRDKELRKREKDLIQSDGEMEKNKQDIENWQAELTTKEGMLRQRSTEFQQKDQDLLQREHDLHIKSQDVLEKMKEIEACEQKLMNQQAIQTAASDQMKNQLEIMKDTLEIREQELRNITHVHDKREEEFKNREKDFDVREKLISKKYEEYAEAEKILESKQNAQREFSEKQKRELENIRQHLEESKKELLTMQDNLQKEKEDFKVLRDHLDNMEVQFKKKEQELLNSQQLFDFKEHGLSERVQELEISKEDNEKWQAELNNKEYHLRQCYKELHEKEQELALRENNLQMKQQELLANNEKTGLTQQFLNNQQNQVTEKLDDQLDGFKQTFAKREQELTKKEDDLQKRERELQINKEQNDHILSDLMEKHEMLEGMKCVLETKQNELGERGKELENNIINKEQELTKRKKELDIKEYNMEKIKKGLMLRDQAFKKTEHELNKLNMTIESKKKSLESHTAELESQKNELNIEKEILKMKSEQLEKWGKYLYNMELKMINSSPSPDFEPWSQHKASNVTQSSATKHLEVGIDGTMYERGNKNSSVVKDDQNAEMGMESKTTPIELDNEEFPCLVSSRGLEIRIEADRNQENRQETRISDKEDAAEEFVKPFTDDQETQGLFYQLSELKLMLIGEAGSSHQSAIRTILGLDVKVGSQWRGKISGKPLLVVEPHGIKWRSSKAINMSFHQELKHSISLCTPGPHAFILLLPAYLTFTRQYRESVECTMDTLGEAAWRHTIVLFTWAEVLGESGQQYIKRNGDLEWLIQKCGGRYHVLDNRHREKYVKEVLEMVYDMVTANHGHYYQSQ